MTKLPADVMAPAEIDKWKKALLGPAEKIGRVTIVLNGVGNTQSRAKAFHLLGRRAEERVDVTVRILQDTVENRLDILATLLGLSPDKKDGLMIFSGCRTVEEFVSHTGREKIFESMIHAMQGISIIMPDGTAMTFLSPSSYDDGENLKNDG